MALNNLQKFLLENKQTDTKVIHLTGRLSGQDFVIRAISMKENANFNRLAMVKDRNNKGKSTFDATKYIEFVVTNGLVEPNLKDAEFIQAAGVTDAVGLLNAIFLPGEVSQLSDAILEYSGYGDNYEEDLVEEVETFLEG